MKNGLVVKDNALINASYNLEVTEQRLMLLAIINARETGNGITADSKLQIHASDYMKHFNVDKKTAYEALKNAVDNLFNRQFSFRETRKGTDFIVKSRWVSRIAYATNEAILEITFAPDVVPLILRLEEHFTSYQLKQVTQLTSKYAIRLYEMLIAWREVGKTPQIELAEFRHKIGVEDNEYKDMHNFKKRVLEPAIKQINEHTDITATYEQHKRGRLISGFSFRFKPKPTPKKEKDTGRDKDTVDMFFNMSDAQVAMYSSKLCRLPEFSYLATGNEGYEVLASKIAKMLKDEKQQKIFVDALKTMGFKPKN